MQLIINKLKSALVVLKMAKVRSQLRYLIDRSTELSNKADMHLQLLAVYIQPTCEYFVIRNALYICSFMFIAYL